MSRSKKRTPPSQNAYAQGLTRRAARRRDAERNKRLRAARGQGISAAWAAATVLLALAPGVLVLRFVNIWLGVLLFVPLLVAVLVALGALPLMSRVVRARLAPHTAPEWAQAGLAQLDPHLRVGVWDAPVIGAVLIGDELVVSRGLLEALDGAEARAVCESLIADRDSGAARRRYRALAISTGPALLLDGATPTALRRAAYRLMTPWTICWQRTLLPARAQTSLEESALHAGVDPAVLASAWIQAAQRGRTTAGLDAALNVAGWGTLGPPAGPGLGRLAAGQRISRLEALAGNRPHLRRPHGRLLDSPASSRALVLDLASELPAPPTPAAMPAPAEKDSAEGTAPSGPAPAAADAGQAPRAEPREDLTGTPAPLVRAPHVVATPTQNDAVHVPETSTSAPELGEAVEAPEDERSTPTSDSNPPHAGVSPQEARMILAAMQPLA